MLSLNTCTPAATDSRGRAALCAPLTWLCAVSGGTRPRIRGHPTGPPLAQTLIMIRAPSAQEGTLSQRLEHKSLISKLLENKAGSIAPSFGIVTGLAGRIAHQAVPRLWPFARFPRLDDPSETSLTPQKVEPLLLCSSDLAPNLHAGPAGAPPDTRRSLAVAPLIGYQRCYGETPASVRRDYGDFRLRPAADAVAPITQKIGASC
jgi:hypothetical protein